VNYYITRGYLVRILRGVYYVKTLEEYKFQKTPDPMTLIAKAMNKLTLEWYFGMYTALRLNGATLAGTLCGREVQGSVSVQRWHVLS
jgi:predicted transcriptional regulator of viral defense system